MKALTLLPLILAIAIVALVFLIVRRTKILERKIVRIWLASAVIWPAAAMGFLVVFFEAGDFNQETLLTILLGPPALLALFLLARFWVSKGK